MDVAEGRLLAAEAAFAATYAAIACWAVVNAVRRRVQAWLAASLAMFASVFIALWVIDAGAGSHVVLMTSLLVVFAGSGIAMLESVARLLTMRRRWRALIATAMVGSLVAVGLSGGFSSDDMEGAQVVAVGSLLLVWVVAVTYAATRLWRATAETAAVERGELRLLGTAYVLMSLMLLAYFGVRMAGDVSGTVMVVWHILGIGVSPLLVAAIWPPAALRQRWLRREAQRLVIRSRRVASWSVDLATGDTFASPGMFEQIGTEKTSFAAVGEFFSHVHPGDVARLQATFHSVCATGVAATDVEFRLVRSDGHTLWLRADMRAMRDVSGAISGVFGISEDVTDSKIAEEQLSARLAHEQRAVEGLRRVDAMKNTFLSAVSHELRTPLTVVQGIAMTMQRHGHSMSDEQEQLLLDRLVGNTMRLNRLLEDLLDLDRLERDALELHVSETDVSSLLAEIVADVPAGGRAMSLDVPPGLRAQLDVAKMQRVFENLVVNAVRHTPADVPVWVRAGCAGGTITIVVEDAGPGVPDGLKPVVFDQFQQGPDATSRGTGVGLALVRRFVELHGGHVAVTDRPGGGASFSVQLPASPDAHLAATAATMAAAG